MASRLPFSETTARRWAAVLLALWALAGGQTAAAQGNLAPAPKREFRGAWVALVYNIDWPSSRTRTPAQQRAEFVSLLNRHQQNGVNAVVVQIRVAADALYPSTLEPWSEWLTGTQGQAPSPFYDPLAFLVRETHRRGMEFHAWINPYRAGVAANPVAPNHVSVLHPDWVVNYGGGRVLNPGLAAVRGYITRVVLDVVRRYDVDAIHFDDYFYPAPQTGLTFDDDAAFMQDPRGFTSRADWRRDNVDLFVKLVSDSIRAAKPRVKFGISPPGVWRNGTSVGGTATTAFASYTDIYADSRKWLQLGWVDYLAPQVYFAIGQNSANYSLIVPWWSQQAAVAPAGGPRHVYIGLATYRASATATDPTWRQPTHLPNQMRLLRQQPNVNGEIFYNTTTTLANPLGFVDSLRQNFFRFPALVPPMLWKDNVPPLAPRQVTQTAGPAGAARLSWLAPPPAPDGETARRYVVYRLPPGTAVTPAALADPARIAAVTDTAFFQETAGAAPAAYAVTALDQTHNESLPQLAATLATQAPGLPAAAQLEPAYPNPFAETLRVAFTLASAGPASLRVLDVTGREVAVLLAGPQTAGRHELTLQRGDWPAGLYVLSLQTEAGTLRQKVTLLR